MDLFVERGYVETTMADIASAAGVAVQTLYLRFGGKPALLASVFDRAVAGDTADVAILDREWVGDLRRTSEFSDAARLIVSNALFILERSTPLYTRIEQASADPEIAELLSETKRRKYETVGALAQMLRAKAGFDRRISLSRTTDMLYSMGSEELFRILCFERGWSRKQWEDFVLSTITQHLGAQ